MEPILNLSPEQFRAALTELQLDPAREAMLVEQYNAANAPQQGGRDRGMLRNLLDNIIGFDDEVVTPGERLGAGAEQFASGLLSDPLGMAGDIAQGGYETIERAMAPGATPMDVMGAAGMAMGAGMSFGAAPANAIGVFAGRRARTADMSALRQAERMSERGLSRDEIWNETGWFKGLDGQWRFEIDDSGSRMRPQASAQAGEYIPINEAFSHLGLSRAYPEMSDPTQLLYRYEKGPTGGSHRSRWSGGGARIDVSAPQQGDMRNARSVTLHEIQHDLQDIEGFLPGANPNMRGVPREIIDNAARLAYNASSGDDELLRELGFNVPGSNAAMPSWEDLTDRQKLEWYDAGRNNLYYGSAGEVESRNVQARADMTPRQRRETPPWMTQDLPDDQQFLRPRANDPLANLKAYIAAAGGVLPR